MVDDPLHEPKRLLTLFSLGNEDSPSWLPNELGSILSHELDTSLRTALREAPDDPVSELKGEWSSDAATVRTLLSHPNPPLPLLERLKRITKKASSVNDGPLPKEVATLLYVASILVAQQRAGEPISNLDEPALRERVQWAARRKWLAPILGELFQAYLNVKK